MMNNNLYGESSQNSNMSNENVENDEPKVKKARYLGVKEHNNNDTELNKSVLANAVDINQESIIDSACAGSNKVNSVSHTEITRNNSPSSFLDAVHCSNDSNNIQAHNDGIRYSPFLTWHARQMFRYDIENKINAALEECFEENLAEYAMLDISNIMDEVESDLEVKDEGILMAIESHGLKTNDSPLNASEGSKSSVDSEQNSETQSSGYQSEPPSQEVLSYSHVYDIDSNDFLNTAVSVAIFEKGLSHSNNN